MKNFEEGFYMKKKTKALMLVLCAVLLVAAACMMVFSKNWDKKPFRIWEETKGLYNGTNGDQDEKS